MLPSYDLFNFGPKLFVKNTRHTLSQKDNIDYRREILEVRLQRNKTLSTVSITESANNQLRASLGCRSTCKDMQCYGLGTVLLLTLSLSPEGFELPYADRLEPMNMKLVVHLKGTCRAPNFAR